MYLVLTGMGSMLTPERLHGEREEMYCISGRGHECAKSQRCERAQNIPETVVLWSSWSVEDSTSREGGRARLGTAVWVFHALQLRLYPEAGSGVHMGKEGAGASPEAERPVRAGSRNPGQRGREDLEICDIQCLVTDWIRKEIWCQSLFTQHLHLKTPTEWLPWAWALCP